MSSLESLENYSIIYSTTHTSQMLNETEPEPSLCDDPECTYPFGPACRICYFSLTMKHDKIDYRGHDEKVNNWIEELKLSNELAKAKGSIFVGGAEERDRSMAEIEASTPAASSAIVASPTALTKKEHKEHKDRDSPKSLPIEMSPPSLSIPTSLSESNKSCNPAPPQLLRWLDVLFDNTLASHKAEKVFVGGATDTKVVRNPCPNCFQPLGDEGLQHLLRCQFAHDEKEREERMMGYY